MSRYFEKFPQIYYPSGDQLKLATDILRRVKFSNRTKDNENGFIEYVVTDGQRPENIASKFYGSANLVWIIFLVNDILNPYHDWVLSSNQLENLITTKYGVGGGDDINQYRLLSDGTIIDVDDEFLLEDGSPLLLEGGLLDGQTLFVFDNPIDVNEPIVSITNRQYEIEKNEKKRTIKLLRPEYVNNAIAELKQKIK